VKSFELERAISENELVLHFQPIVDVPGRQLRGLEALVRWKHPQRGIVSPMEFISEAETSGLIRKLTLWVLREALLHSSVWRRDGAPTTVGVNLSPVDIHDAGFRRFLQNTLKVAGGAEHLVAEVPARGLAVDPPVAMLELMRSMGVRVAIDGDDPRTVCDRAMFELAYSSGLRVSELISLTVKDIDSARMVIHVRHGKGRKDRYVMLSDQLLNLLRSYWKIDRPHHWLFPGADPQRHITARQLERVCRQTAEVAGLSKNVTVHTLRHCFASHLVGGGADLRVVQELLGHSDINTTQIYTHVDPGRLKSIHEKYHPRR